MTGRDLSLRVILHTFSAIGNNGLCKKNCSVFFYLLLLILISSGTFAQKTPDPLTADYSKADSIAIHFPKQKNSNYADLATTLTASLTSDHEKFRVLFRWITENIQYNFGQPSDNPDKAMKNKKAVCIGYSTLLKDMCKNVGIECVVISGYSKTQTKDIGTRRKKTDHAWNAVRLYGKWYLLDVTWATGYYDYKKNKAFKEYDEFYYLTPPGYFIRTHFPEDSQWQLLNKKVHKSQFVRWHLFYKHYFAQGIQLINPVKGSLKIKHGKTLTFQMITTQKTDSVDILLSGYKYSLSLVIQTLSPGTYFILQVFEKPGVYEMTLFINEEAVAGYKLKVK
jgi:hypothetical protein